MRHSVLMAHLISLDAEELDVMHREVKCAKDRATRHVEELLAEQTMIEAAMATKERTAHETAQEGSDAAP